MNGIDVDFRLIDNFDLNVENWDFFWKVIELIHIKTIDYYMPKKKR